MLLCMTKYPGRVDFVNFFKRELETDYSTILYLLVLVYTVYTVLTVQ